MITFGVDDGLMGQLGERNIGAVIELRKESVLGNGKLKLLELSVNCLLSCSTLGGPYLENRMNRVVFTVTDQLLQAESLDYYPVGMPMSNP